MADAAQQGDIQALLEEGIRLYGAGQPAKALELWYRVLDLEPRNPTALEYVQYVRDNFHVDVREPGFGVPVVSAASAPPPDWSAEVEPAPEVVAASVVEAPAPERPVVAAADAQVSDVDLMPAPTLSRPVVKPAPVVDATPTVEPMPTAQATPAAEPAPVVESTALVNPAPVVEPAPLDAFGAGWGDLAAGDLDLDPLTGKPVQRPAESDDVRSRRASLVEPEPTVPAEAPATPEPTPALSAVAAAEEERVAAEVAVPVDPVPVDDEVEPAAPQPPEIPALAVTPLPPSDAAPAAAVVDDDASLDALVAAQATAEAASPWDGHSGITEAVDLDSTSPEPSPMELLLAGPVRRPLLDGGLRGPPHADEPAASAPSETPPEPQSEVDSLMEGARDLFELGDFSGSLELVEKVLRQDPANAEAHAYFVRNEATLLKMYESRLGDLSSSPRVLTSPDEVIWMNMHHRAGFVLSQVDGELSYEDIAAISGMSRFETFRILAELVQNGVIG